MRRWIVPGLLAVALLSGCGQQASRPQLSRPEHVAEEYLIWSYMKGQTNEKALSKITTLGDGTVSGALTPGPAWFAQVPNGPQGVLVWIFNAPQTTTGPQLTELTMSRQHGHWYVTKEDNSYELGLPHTSFAGFQKLSIYHRLGVTHWQEVTLK